MSDLDTVVPDVNTITLESGKQVVLSPLKTRQFFKLFKILTHGAAGALGTLSVEPDESAALFLQKLLALVVLAIPDAEDEAIEFIQSMVEPVGLVKKAVLTKAEKEKNQELLIDLFDDLVNPDIMDTVTIIEEVIKENAGDIQALGKRLRKMLDLALKTGEVKIPEEASSETVSETSQTDTLLAASV